MSNISSHKRTLRMVQIALLSALVLVLQFFFSSAKIGIIEMNFCLIPIVIAGALVDPVAGLIVGAFSGVATFFQVLTVGGTFYNLLVNTNVVAAAVVCILKVSLAGLLTGLVYKVLRKAKLHSALSCIIASAVCPIVNSGIFCLGMFVFYSSALVASPELGAGQDIFTIVILGLVAPNFPIEFLSTTIITPVISQALIAAKIFKD